MTEAQTILAPESVIETREEATSIAVVVANNPVVVLLDNKKRGDLYAHIEQEIAAFVPDLTTAKGRDAIKALAYKITRTKTAIDAAGKQLNEEARAKISVVDEARRDSRNTLDLLAERVRKPLTDWEDAETARIAECREVINWLKSSINVFMDDTAEAVRERGMTVYNTQLDPEKYGDLLAEAEEAKTTAINSLKASLARLVKEEADRAELARLQQAEAERLAKEAEQRAAEEQKQREEEESARAEQARLAAEKAEQDRIANAEREAAERARQEAAAKAEADRAEAQRIADAERIEQERKHQAELAEQRRIAEEAEQRERERVAREQAEANERAAREADQAHRTSVKTAAKEALIATGVTEEMAVKVVLAILAGDIPAVKMEF